MRGQLLPGEPDDTDNLADAVHWVNVYVEVLQTLTRVGRDTPSVGVLDRLVAGEARLRWWQGRLEELGAEAIV